MDAHDQRGYFQVLVLPKPGITPRQVALELGALTGLFGQVETRGKGLGTRTGWTISPSPKSEVVAGPSTRRDDEMIKRLLQNPLRGARDIPGGAPAHRLTGVVETERDASGVSRKNAKIDNLAMVEEPAVRNTARPDISDDLT